MHNREIFWFHSVVWHSWATGRTSGP